MDTLGHKIEDPVPSLFSFNMPNDPITKLTGIVVENTLVSIQSTKIKTSGALLITHLGFSGPAILKLSSFGAKILNKMNYNFKIQVNWIGEQNNEKVTNYLKDIINIHQNKILSSYRPYDIPERLWLFLLEKRYIYPQKKWGELGNKGINKLVNILANDEYTISDESTNKEEFVTCGGVSLQSVNLKTMESKVCENLYFAGEVLNIDAITGGFNFQAAWTTGFIAGKLL